MTLINCSSEPAVCNAPSLHKFFNTVFPTLFFPYPSLLSPDIAIAMPTLTLTPSSVSSRTVISADRFKIQSQFNEAILDTLREVKGFHELVITNVPPGWEDFLWEVEEDLPCIRKTYNPDGRCLRLKIMPTYAHNCIAEWIASSISRAGVMGFLNLAELDLLLLQNGTSEFS